MSPDRKNYGENPNIELVSEVSGRCPVCNRAVMRKKGSTLIKQYEIAHIYPLNPSEAEIELLKDEEKLSNDLNALDNLIVLCKLCHKYYDTKKTIEDYKEMCERKKSLQGNARICETTSRQNLETQISQILDCLAEIDICPDAELKLDPKEIEKKISPKEYNLLVRKIRLEVNYYYDFIKKYLERLNRIDPGVAELLAIQIRGCYLSLAREKIKSDRIFSEMVGFIKEKSNSTSREACEILASFYVQNCEVFDDRT